ncbi:2'-5'-oligoadenylate synthase 1A isoform X2 [Nematostella vectensis]|uniref:2'-5'-oligoadenylate synthase 1A isoform X2 n=1 Tax=Nematostella vectensis TaxID=45351 RepID=UPI00138FB5C6|nr:2'-5'-oligoadenylate synthase 1A isoform X2 [Nematostella vectensis]
MKVCKKCFTSFKKCRSFIDHEIRVHGRTEFSWWCPDCPFLPFMSQRSRDDHCHMAKQHRRDLRGGKMLRAHVQDPFSGRSMDTAELNKYITENLRASDTLKDHASEALDAIFKKIQEDDKLQIRELVKAGSLAKGTALKDSSDLDCVMIMNGIETVADLKKKLPDIQEQVSACLRNPPPAWKIEDLWNSRFAVQFKFKMKHWLHGEVEVDLLPTFQADVESYEGRRKLYSQMHREKGKDILKYYSAAACKLQRDFIKELPSNVKDLILLVKKWRKNYQLGLSSYFMELVVVHEWQKAKKPERFDTKKGFKAIMEALYNYEELYAMWDKYYEKKDVPREIIQTRPLVLDPANPTNNLCEGIAQEKWDELEEAAKMTLDSPFLQSTHVTPNWK